MENSPVKRPYNYRYRIIRSEAGSEFVESREERVDMEVLVQEYRKKGTASLLAVFDHEAGAFEMILGDDVAFVRQKMNSLFDIQACPPGVIMR